LVVYRLPPSDANGETGEGRGLRPHLVMSLPLTQKSLLLVPVLDNQ